MLRPDTERGVIGQDINLESVIQPQATEGRGFSGLKRVFTHPYCERSIEVLSVLVIAVGTTLLSLPFLQKNFAQAEGNNSPTKVGPLTRADDPVSFSFTNTNGQLVNGQLRIVRGTFANSGSGRGIDTEEIYHNGVLNTSFQPDESDLCYPEIAPGKGIRISLVSHAIRVDRNKLAFQPGVTDNVPGVVHPKGGEIASLDVPGDLSQRICLPSGGLPDVSSNNVADYDPLVWVTDTSGDYLEQGFRNTPDPSKAGKYRLRLNAAFQGIGTWVKQAQAYYYGYFPVILRSVPY